MKGISKARLLKFLNGKCSPEEAADINRFLCTWDGQALLNKIISEQWLCTSENGINEELLLKWKEEWSLKFEDNLTEKKPKPIDWTQLIRYAAILTGLFICVALYGITTRKTAAVKPLVSVLRQINLYGHQSNFRLSDGTHVYLGPGSILTFPSKFVGRTREVNLEGEAYFEVARNIQKPFIITTENIKTQVLGTTFKVTSFKKHPVTVSVTSGKVKVDRVNERITQNLAVLLPGEQVSVNGSKLLRSTFNVESVKNWKKGQLVFNRTPFRDVTEEIGRWYNLFFVFLRPGFDNIPITLTLDANIPVDVLLKTLSVTLGFDYQIIGKQVVIK